MYTTQSSSPQPIDREQVRQQLAALGYKAGDTVYLRAFYPDSDPRKTKDVGRKTEATKLDQVIAYAAKFQSEGRGIYLVVNGGGHADKDVTKARAIFYEHDNLDKATQIELWKKLGLPEPTFQLDTGGKSIHSYWVFDESVVVENWKSLQADLLEFADADRSIKNPSRVMRLAGAWHSSGRQSLIISHSGKCYNYSDLREILPAPKAETPLFQSKQPKNVPVYSDTAPKRCEDIALPVPASVPLEKCLAVSSRDLLNGVSEGGRNNAGHKLACDLIGTASYLQTIRQSFDGDAESLFQDFGDRCNPPLNAGELRSIWKSAQGSNPSPACQAEGVDNCIRGWYWKNHAEKRSGGVIGETKSNVLTHPRFASPDPAELTEQFATIYKADLFGHKLTKALQPLGLNLQQTRKNYEEYIEEIEHEEQRADRKTDVEKLISISKRRLTLENYLHPSLAEPIKKVATWMGVDPEAVFTHLLPIVAGLINPNSRIVAKECINFVEPFLLYTGVVSKTGSRKSPTLNVPKEPLIRLQSMEDRRHQQALQLYEAELQTLKESKNKGNDELPQKPNPPREFYLDNATVEAVDKVKGQQPDHGCTLIKDELSGLFASHGAYKGGKGSDKESYLSGWNGGGVKKNRSGDGSRVSLARDSLSITGGIQPDKLRALLGDFNDSQGEWARFLWYQMPMRPYKIPRDDTRYDLNDLLEGIYKKIDALPVLRLRFNKQGQTYWDDWHDKKDEQKRAETRPGLQAAIAKMPGQSVRLIGLLHVLWEVASDAAEVREEIPLEIVKSGCKLAEFYLGQVRLLQGDGDVLNGEITPTLKLLLEKVTERGSLTATEAKKTLWSLRKVAPDKIRQYFNELAAMNLASVQGTGSRLTLTPNIPTVDEHQQHPNPFIARIPDGDTSKELRIVDEVLRNHQQPESFMQQGIQDIKYQTVDGVDAISTAEIIIQTQKVELDSSLLICEPTICINTSTSSTVGAQPYVEQESLTVDATVENSSTVGNSSTVDEFSTDNLTHKQPIAPPELPDQNLARRIGEALYYQSPAVAGAINHDLEDAINAGQLTEVAVIEIVGFDRYQEFRRLVEARLAPEPTPAPESTPEPITAPAPAPEPTPAPELTPEFEIGDRVIVTEHSDRLHKGVKGEIGGKWPRKDSISYQIKLDKASRGQWAIKVDVPRQSDGLTYLMREPKKPCK